MYEWVSVYADSFVEDPGHWLGNIRTQGVMILDDDDKVIALVVPPAEEHGEDRS